MGIDRRFYTCEDVAELYGVKLSTVWKWIRDGKLAAYVIGKVYRIDEEQLKEFEMRISTKERLMRNTNKA